MKKLSTVFALVIALISASLEAVTAHKVNVPAKKRFTIAVAMKTPLKKRSKMRNLGRLSNMKKPFKKRAEMRVTRSEILTCTHCSKAFTTDAGFDFHMPRCRKNPNYGK